MVPSKVAEELGCTTQHVRFLIREGRMRASLVKTPVGSYYEVAESEVEKFKVQSNGPGRPRKNKKEMA